MLRPRGLKRERGVLSGGVRSHQKKSGLLCKEGGSRELAKTAKDKVVGGDQRMIGPKGKGSPISPGKLRSRYGSLRGKELRTWRERHRDTESFETGVKRDKGTKGEARNGRKEIERGGRNQGGGDGL